MKQGPSNGQVVVLGDFPFARFKDHFVTTLGSYKTAEEATARFVNTNKYEKIAYVADTFELSLENIFVQPTETRGEFIVTYDLVGPTKVLKEVLTSLYGNSIPGVVAAREMARPVRLFEAQDPEE